MEKTFVAIKPDGVGRGLIGQIITKFEQKGFKIVALKMLHLTKEMAETHYIEHKGKSFFEPIVNFLSSGPIVAIALEGTNAVETVRKIVGATNPQEASTGTIRFDFAMAKESNVIHASDSQESAKREIDLYFTKQELCLNWAVLSEKWLEH